MVAPKSTCVSLGSSVVQLIVTDVEVRDVAVTPPITGGAGSGGSPFRIFSRRNGRSAGFGFSELANDRYRSCGLDKSGLSRSPKFDDGSACHSWATCVIVHVLNPGTLSINCRS